MCRILLPLYSYPSWYAPASYQWPQVAAAAVLCPLTVIVNPNSGPGGPPNADYVQGLRHLRTQDKRIRLLGYVATGYGLRARQEVLADVATYTRHWRVHGVSGVFLDETPNTAAMVDYYARLCQAIPATLRPVVLNPGTRTEAGYAALGVNVVFEGSYVNWLHYEPDAWVLDGDAGRHAALVYACPDATEMRRAVNLARRRNIGQVYVTDDAMPNPWDVLPSYWRDEAAYVGGG
jgi:hypothetical protein